MHFSERQWRRVEENARLWWDGKLERPLIQLTVWGSRVPDRAPPRMTEGVNRRNIYDFSIPPEDIVDRWDWDLSGAEWLGDAFPCVCPDFGPGVIAACLGAVADPRPDTVWFHQPGRVEAKDLHLHYDPKNTLAIRIKDICSAATGRWRGAVQVAMTDLGGNLDILSTFRPGEQLLLDLYDNPEEVKRLTWEAHKAWMDAFNDINRCLTPGNRGYTAWAPIFSSEPYYMLQCDFCYMIGPDMFDEFVKPELEATCREFPHPFYHLDGTGQLPHLDSLLTIRELKGVQWVPGAGQPGAEEWPDVYRKILGAGKLTQIWTLNELTSLHEALGTAKGFVVTAHTNSRERAAAEDILARYGA